jgi:hypothetical protein
MSGIDFGKLETLILARLSVGSKKAPTPLEVEKSLHGMLARQITVAEWRGAFARALADLRGAGLVEERALRLTESGLDRVRELLSLTRAPRVKSWKAFKLTYLPRLLLGAPPPPEGVRVDVRASVLAQRLGVAPIHDKAGSKAKKPEAQAARAVDAWLAQRFGLPNAKVDLGRLRAALLAEELELPANGKRFADIAGLGISTLSGAPNSKQDTVTNALLGRWLCDAPPHAPHAPHAAAEDDDPEGPATLESSRDRAWPVLGSSVDAEDAEERLLSIASKVRRAANGPGVRSFGPNKIFIASVWEVLATDAEVASLGEGGFKALLAEAHRRGLLVLSRADLVAAMDPRLVMASEIRHQNATYHFVQRGASA